MNYGGYTNRVAWVDFTTGSVEYRPIAEEDPRKYIARVAWASSMSLTMARRWMHCRPTTSCVS